jgi:hypothetical protein
MIILEVKGISHRPNSLNVKHKRCHMKQTSMAIGITLFLTIFTSLPYAGAGHEPRGVAGGVHWINPDGSQGTAVMSAVSNLRLAWANPDGTEGIVKRHSGPAPAVEYAWANPDGHRNPSMRALSGGEHESSAKMTSKRTDVTRYNDQGRHEVTRGDGRMNMLTFLLGMLVAGVSLLLIRQLWPA